MNNVKWTARDSIIWFLTVSFVQIIYLFVSLAPYGIRNQKNGSLNTKSIVYFIVRQI